MTQEKMEGLSPSCVGNYLAIAKALPEQYIRLINHESHNPKDLTITKALILAKVYLKPDKLKEMVELIKQSGLTRSALAGKLAEGVKKSKLRRVHQGRVYWKELTRIYS